MKIVRDSYERITYRYTLDVNADYVKEINDYAKQNLAEPDTWVDLTEQDFADAMNTCDGTDKLKAEYEMKYGYQPEGKPIRTYTIQVGEWLNDVINDDLWESDNEIIDGEGYDYDTWIED